jgi:hypothetical protein
VHILVVNFEEEVSSPRRANFLPDTGGKCFTAWSDDVRGALFKPKAAMFLFSDTILFLYSGMRAF